MKSILKRTSLTISMMVAATTTATAFKSLRRMIFSLIAVAIIGLTSYATTYDIVDGDVAGLAAAISASNANCPSASTINLAPSGTYTLTAVAENPPEFNSPGPVGLPVIRCSITINGNGATVQRSIAPGTPHFVILAVSGRTAICGTPSCFTDPNLTINQVILAGGTLGLQINSGTALVHNSTITQNTGGGITNACGRLTLSNSTVSNNTSGLAYGGGGIFLWGFSCAPGMPTANISFSTIFENQNTSGTNSGGYPYGPGYAIANAFGDPSVTIKNSILASPTRAFYPAQACYWHQMTPAWVGRNIVGDNSCGANVASGDLILPNLTLGPLANNGGPTPTHALLSGSPAIDAVPSADCTTIGGLGIPSDQRGGARPIGAGCDIGAFESGDLTVGLVSYWPADGDTNDVIGNNHGIFRNGSAFDPGSVGDSFSLSGANYVEVPDSPSLSLTGPLTISANIKLNNNTAQQAIVEKYDIPAYQGFLLRVESGKLVATVCPSHTICSQPPARGATTVSVGEWHHVAAVFDGSTIAVYLDGVLDGIVNTALAPTDGTASLKIGARGDDANTRLNGLIDEVRLYNRALPAQEIAALSVFDSTPPAITPTLTGTLGNNGWYTSDVEITWTVSDPDSGVNSTTGCEAQQVNVDTSSVTFACSATSAGGTSQESVTIKRDATAPTITLNSPTAGNYLLNQAATASFTCSDAASGVANCEGSMSDGSAVDTSTTGAKSFTVDAEDNAGNTATTRVDYTVAYGVVALYDQTRAHKSGSTIPIKIRLVDANGVNVSSPLLLPHAISVFQTSSQASTEFGDAGNANPDFDFRYDAELCGYVFNLQTTGFGTGSYVLNFTANSGSAVYSVGFQVRK